MVCEICSRPGGVIIYVWFAYGVYEIAIGRYHIARTLASASLQGISDPPKITM